MAEVSIKLFDYKVLNEENIFEEEDKDNREFIVQAFGLSEKGESYCIYIQNVTPFFYVKVDDSWNSSKKERFLEYIIEELGSEKTQNYYKDSILECKLVKKKKLYGFDDNKLYKFVYLKFKNNIIFNKVKNLWYTYKDEESGERTRILSTVKFENTETSLYEASIPPLLRFFHLKNISPSGWIKFSPKKAKKPSNFKTSCDFEYNIIKEHITSQPNKETTIPLKICSFDIEASSSHGDFPLPVKNYKKLADNLVEYWDYNDFQDETRDAQEKYLKNAIISAFNGKNMPDFINQVYSKKHTTTQQLEPLIQKLLNKPLKDLNKEATISQRENQKVSEWCRNVQEEQNGENQEFSYGYKSYLKKDVTIIDLLNDEKFKREDKVNEITKTLDIIFPLLQGDKVTFIGSTFWKYGEPDTYLNHCIVLGHSSNIPNVEIENYSTEKKVLLAWTDLIQRENPDIIIGYNIFGFDYTFMFNRAKELGILRSFLKLSKNKGEICGKTKDYRSGKEDYKLTESTLKIASGTHELKFIEMTGRINIDLYNYFRREYNLDSYKLDSVASNFIGDVIKDYEHLEDNKSKIISKNLKGLIEESFIKFEEIGHTSDSYNHGEKFKVLKINKDDSTIIINGQPKLNRKKLLKWGLAKDDVTPQDIFRLTETGKSQDKAIVAKYCVQDCNLVHYLMNKIDILTGFVEMSNICSVPINFLVMRGQGIKLYSFLSKRCRELNTLMPDLNKSRSDDGYEGATVLIPKTNLYLDEPVACVDYSSLYPSSIISDNLSHDSKVWTKEYDLENNLIKETGSTQYDNLPNYKYVNVTYDTFQYIRKNNNPKAAAVKVKTGYKVCRFAQFPDGKKAIIPSILEELLAARKATRTMAKFKTVITKDGNEFSGLLTKKETQTIIIDKDKNKHIIENDNITSVNDTYDDFMKNIFDKRQLGYKITANSTYGQMGAKTSNFYEKDVAASTTAVGRMLLTYGKRIIEEVYGDRICETKYGKVHSHAEYIYGDTDSVFMSFKLTDLDGKPIVGKEALKHTIELAKEAGELATKFLKKPHDLEYEKTFLPFCLLSKKRYVGMLYEEDPDKCKRKSMGIVLKRRDNAPIVKDIYGGVIDILMEPIKDGETEQDKIKKAMDFTRKFLQDMVDEKFPTSKLIITKSLRSFYKNPQQIAHKVLADRMGIRDPGNKPGPGDRIPFMYIQTKGKVKLQGDRIEHPKYIEENNLKPDYTFYITNQIMKPLLQVFALVLYKMPEFKRKRRNFENKLAVLKQTLDPEKYEDKVTKLKNSEVEAILFENVLRQVKNKKDGNQSIANFFKGF